MKDLKVSAQLYLFTVYLLASIGVGLLAFGAEFEPSPDQWVIWAILAVIAGTTQLFVVQRTGSHYSDHLTPAPLFTALLLLPGPLLVLIIGLAFLPEWLWYRRKWFIQSFNIASWIVAAALGRLAVAFFAGADPLDSAALTSVLSVYILMAVFFGVQTLLLGIALRLARGLSFRESGLFSVRKILVEIALLHSGWAVAIAWGVNPIASLAAAIPLLLIFQALHVPNLMEEASTDPKTGLANARHFNLMLTRDLDHAQRSGTPAALLMCDLDYLRNINNTYGHQAGDVVLCGVAELIRHNIRACDVAGRFGGEEFIILLTDTDAAGGEQIAERIRSEVAQMRFAAPGLQTIVQATISIGVAASPSHASTPDALLREADLAVYQAKREGRNRVIVAGRASRELAGEWARDNLMPDRRHLVGEALLDARMPFWRFIRETTRLSVSAQAEAESANRRQTHAAAAPDEPRSARYQPSDRVPPSAMALIALVFTGGLLGLAPAIAALPPLPEIHWERLILFAALTVLAEQVAVTISSRGKTSISVVPILAASFLDGELGALSTVLTFAVWAKIRARSPWYRMLFNFGNALIAAQSARQVFALLMPGPVGEGPFHWLIVPGLLAGLVYYGVNHLLLCSVRRLTEHRPIWHIWLADYQWLWKHYGILGIVAVVVAATDAHLGSFGVIALMAPLGVMQLAIQQYIERTTVYVEELKRMNARLRDSYEATLVALGRALDTRDAETEEHSERVRRYAELLTRQLRVPEKEIEHIARGAMLHDIGKIGVPDSILLKPDRLTADETTLMRKHPVIGYGMIADIPFLAKAAEIVLYHHERYDGDGYPSGLRGDTIPISARIFAVADALDAMTSDRPYRPALSLEVALAEIQRCGGEQFDPTVVAALLAIPREQILLVRESSGDARGMATILGSREKETVEQVTRPIDIQARAMPVAAQVCH